MSHIIYRKQSFGVLFMDKSIQNYTFQEIYDEDSYMITEKLTKEFSYELPEFLDNPEDLRKAGVLLGELCSAYSYLVQLASFGKLLVRELKRKKAPKDEIDNAIDKRDIINNLSEIIKLQYNTVSRMVSIKQQINYELKMSDGR